METELDAATREHAYIIIPLCKLHVVAATYYKPVAAGAGPATVVAVNHC